MTKIKELFRLKRHDYEFLPAVLSIQEAPPSPIGRMIIWVLAAFVSIMLLWAAWGEVDIVAIAQGKVIPDGNVKIVQPAQTGVVKDIFVSDGDYVKKDDVLIRLDKIIVSSKLNQVDARLSDSKARLAVYKKIASDIVTGKTKSNPEYSNGTPVDIIARSNLLLQKELDDFFSKTNSQNREIERLKSQKTEAQRMSSKLMATTPIVRKRHKAIDRLFNLKMVSEKDYLDSKQAILEAEFDLEYQQDMVRSLDIQISAGYSKLDEILNGKLLDLQNKISELSSNIDELEQEKVQYLESMSQHDIKAPIDGYVQDLVIHTIGGSLNATEPALKIVPNKDELVVEAMVLNRDIGFLKTGQETVIKIDTFDFIKHGALKGKIINISGDAIQDEKLGLVFKTKVKIEKNEVEVDGLPVKINSGMSVVVEAKTGKRKIIDFFLNPVRKSVSESIKER